MNEFSLEEHGEVQDYDDGGWQISTLDGKKCFLNSTIDSENTIVFCLLSNFKKDPYLAKLTAAGLKKQCEGQGFVDESILQIQTNLRCQSTSGSLKLDFLKKDSVLEAAITISSTIKVTLRMEISVFTDGPSVQIYRSLLRQTLTSSFILQKFTERLENLLHLKDKAIDYLKISVEDLGTEKMINKWAPRDSTNAKSLVKYEHSKEFGSMADSLVGEMINEEKAIETGESLLNSYKDLKYFLSVSNSPRKRLRRRSSADFLPYEEPLKPFKTQPDESMIKRELKHIDIVTDTQMYPESKRKKRKFGKVRITKKKDI